jgi:L-seryl-tRNA(Ser) seleniumtransferase
MLAQLTGAESAVVVNNGAAAALLVLTALSGGGEVILSRGELVEIGGDFRIPDVMIQSGAQLDEVGTTNRTKLADYERAISSATTMLMRVHPSNFRLVGFTAAPELRELAQLAHRHGLILYEDAGSGALIDLTKLGVDGEPMIAESIQAGAHVVSFSGDKLLGGVQAGFIVGRTELIDRVRSHPLYRALRPDKTTLAAVEATLAIYRRGAAVEEIPALAMIAAHQDEIGKRALALAQLLNEDERTANLQVELTPGESAIGGGSAPTTHPPTMLIALSHPTLSADALAAALRRHDPPVIARIYDGRVVLDLRTVSVTKEPELLAALRMAGN